MSQMTTLIPLIILIFISYYYSQVLEPFTVLTNKEAKDIDYNQFTTLTSNLKFAHPPVVTGSHKNIITEIKTSHLDQVNFAIDSFVKQLNSQKFNSWKSLELITFSKKIIDSTSSSFNIELLLLETSFDNIPFHLSFVCSLNINSGNIKFTEITLYNQKSKFDNAYNPDFKGYFEIKNILGLLSPFKTSEPRLITPEDLAISKIKKQPIGPSCLNKPTVKTESECTSQAGIWDQPVSNDTHCPFFRSNIHYPNKRGHSKGGFCELPSGLQLKGYRFFDPNPQFPALCYNCKSKPNGGTDTCCNDQLDSSKYPQLNGYPDYKYPGDSQERSHYKNEFKSNQLNYN